jgi:hypothetical protein
MPTTAKESRLWLRLSSHHHHPHHHHRRHHPLKLFIRAEVPGKEKEKENLGAAINDRVSPPLSIKTHTVVALPNHKQEVVLRRVGGAWQSARKFYNNTCISCLNTLTLPGMSKARQSSPTSNLSVKKISTCLVKQVWSIDQCAVDSHKK